MQTIVHVYGHFSKYLGATGPLLVLFPGQGVQDFQSSKLTELEDSDTKLKSFTCILLYKDSLFQIWVANYM